MTREVFHQHDESNTGLAVVATFEPSHQFGRVLAAYGGVFIVGSLLWGVVFDGFHPDRADFAGAAVCLLGVGIIMSAFHYDHGLGVADTFLPTRSQEGRFGRVRVSGRSLPCIRSGPAVKAARQGGGERAA